MLLSLAMVVPSAAQAGTVIANPAVVFEGNARDQIVTLHNQGQAPVTYRIATSPLLRQPDGTYADPPPDTTLPATEDTSTFVRFSPRQVTVPPGGYQSIKLSLRKPAELPPGEYRLALTILELADQESLDKLAATGSLVVGVQIAHRLTIRIKHQ
jgi:P pilus assembly chaperone PapD